MNKIINFPNPQKPELVLERLILLYINKNYTNYGYDEKAFLKLIQSITGLSNEKVAAFIDRPYTIKQEIKPNDDSNHYARIMFKFEYRFLELSDENALKFTSAVLQLSEDVLNTIRKLIDSNNSNPISSLKI